VSPQLRHRLASETTGYSGITDKHLKREESQRKPGADTQNMLREEPLGAMMRAREELATQRVGAGRNSDRDVARISLNLGITEDSGDSSVLETG
jgi:hypothetical protein